MEFVKRVAKPKVLSKGIHLDLDALDFKICGEVNRRYTCMSCTLVKPFCPRFNNNNNNGICINTKSYRHCRMPLIILENNKLHAFDIRGDYIKWFRNYLTDRTQYFNFNVNNLLNVHLNGVSPKDQSLFLYFLSPLSMTYLMFLMFSSMCCKQ